MRRAEMQVNVAGIRRNIKNIAHNYSDAQKKVREATSNDQWGPSSTIMTEISDLTYNVVAFSEIMHMVWKRLNDHGRNWRHVYKALLLLEYLIKTGTEKVAQQCKENIFAIQTLKDFQYLEEGRDQGNNVREKARHLVDLLKDDERLKNERARAIKAKERLGTNHSGFGSDGGTNTPPGGRYPNYPGDKYKTDWGSRDTTSQSHSDQDTTDLPRDIEVARPQTAGEEELQLQLALAMSREEAEQEEQKKRSDEVRLQLALSESQQDFKNHEKPTFDLLDVNLDENKAVDPWGMPHQSRPQHPNVANIGWSQSAVSSPPPLGLPPSVGAAAAASALAGAAAPDPWSVPTAPSTHHSNNNNNNGVSNTWSPARMGAGVPLQETAIRHDPWSPGSHSSSGDLDEFDIITNRNKDDQLLHNDRSNNTSAAANDPFELNLLGDMLPIASTNGSGPSPSTGATKKTPQSFLGENSALVNLDNLVTSKPVSTVPTNPLVANPFSETPIHPALNPVAAPQQSRPVFNPPPKQPTMNQIKQQSPFLDAHATIAGHTSPSPHFNGGGNEAGLFGSPMQMHQQQHSDPWAPVVPTTGTQSAPSPWIKPGEQPVNPFLS